MLIRRFQESDSEAVSQLIRRTIEISNKKDYPEDLMDDLIRTETPEYVLGRAGWTHMYVVLDGEKTVGCGAIGPYWGKEDESCLFTIFVLPEYQGKGVGRHPSPVSRFISGWGTITRTGSVNRTRNI